MRKHYRFFGVVVLLLGAFALVGCKAAIVGPVAQTCSTTNPGTVDVTFHWTPSSEPNAVQYLDLSLYSTFPPGAFLGVGPLPAGTNSFSWPGLIPNAVHHWRVNTLIDGAWYTSWTGTFTTLPCAGDSGVAPPAGMRIVKLLVGNRPRTVVPRIWVNAPVNVRVVGLDGVMGAPNGKDDVIWYDFSSFSGMGGFPGVPQANALFSGHVDYHPHYTAVFWDVRQLVPGDIIDVYLLDGRLVRYSVQWSKWIAHNENFSSYAVRTGEEILTIVTCVGSFDPSTRNYSNRLVVRAKRIW